MTSHKQNLISAEQTLQLDRLQQLQEKPPLFAPGESLFWDDDHISTQMLQAHLDPTTNAASYRPERIERSVAWLINTLAIGPDSTILDLGCGPGLYTIRLAQHGCRVTGVDYSRRSITYAKEQAQAQNLGITYRYQDYLTLEDVDQYDVALLISHDFCPLAPERRARLLDIIHRALKAGGHFILYVTTPAYGQRHQEGTRWYAADGGFWKPGLHLVLEQRFVYPEEAVHLTQFNVIEPEGRLTVFRNWLQTFTQQTITAELEQSGFQVRSIGSDLTGAPYAEDSEWLGIVARKVRMKHNES